ncbi:MAG: hypothetical protein ACREMR_00570, partial [Gemmatimonadales bacterium]
TESAALAEGEKRIAVESEELQGLQAETQKQEKSTLASDHELRQINDRLNRESSRLSVARLEQPGLKAGGHAGAAELAEGALQFDEVHVGISSWVFRAMRSR